MQTIRTKSNKLNSVEKLCQIFSKEKEIKNGKKGKKKIIDFLLENKNIWENINIGSYVELRKFYDKLYAEGFYKTYPPSESWISVTSIKIISQLKNFRKKPLKKSYL